MTNHETESLQSHEISEADVGRLYHDCWGVIRLAEKSTESRVLASGLTKATADGFDVIYGGEHYDKLEALFRPESGSVEGRGWLGHLWLLNHKVQRRFDFRDGRIEITNMLANGRWTDPRPLEPEHFGEFDAILKGVEAQLSAKKVGQLALVEAA